MSPRTIPLRALAVAGGLLLAAGLATGPVLPSQAAPSVTSTTVAVGLTANRPTVERTDAAARTARTQSTAGKEKNQLGTLDRVVAQAEQGRAKRFSMVGVTWKASDGQTAPEVQVQTKGGSGWSDWSTITDGDPLEGADGTLSTEPTYVGDSTGVRVRLLGDTSTKPKDVELVLLDSRQAASDDSPTMSTMASSTGDLAPKPAVVTRAGWGANESWKNCSTPDIDKTIKGVAVHHTAGSNSYTAAQAAGIVRSTYSYHARTLGWCDIGYNFLIDKFGTIYEGRAGGQDIPVHGAHATSWNTDTMGISFMGNYDTATPPAAMLEAGARITAWKLDAFQRQAKGTTTLAGKKVNIIFGHRDVMQTACPGRYVVSKMSWLRDRVETLMGGRSPIYSAWVNRGDEKGVLGSPAVAERGIAEGGRYAGFTGGDLVWHPSRGAYDVLGAIRTRYRAIGLTSSHVGWPTSNEKAGPFGSRMNSFTAGRMYWSNATGAWEIHGAFNRNYSTAHELVKLPTGTEYKSPKLTGAIRQNFQEGRMYYHGSSGGWAVNGAIYRYYVSTGEEASPVGLPTSNEQVVGTGRQNTFAQGAILWSNATGAHATYGAIYRTYRDLGGAKSRLGFPVADERATTGGRLSQFQGGTITYSFTTGKTKVTYQ